jgi:LuxR family maltose regulon positive regulatory protein
VRLARHGWRIGSIVGTKTPEHGVRPGAQDGVREPFEPGFPLVEAKLHPPTPRPGFVPRTRLIRLLKAEPRPPVVSIIAPPGYGKTVLLAEWAAREDRPVAWLTLDEFDNDPSVFLAYLAVAIDRISPIDGSIRTAILAPESRLLGAAVPRLAAELHRIGRPVVLVLDDAHRLVSSTCLDALALLLDHLPPGLQVALAARTAPDLPLGRLRAQRDLLEIATDDLALDLGETSALAAAAGDQLDPDEARDLAERTEGWAAAIYLATLARKRTGLRPSPNVLGSVDYIAEYLRSEFLSDVGADNLAFLARTSILDVVEPPVAEAVSGMPGAAARLQALLGANQLIGQVAGAGAAYRYHTLLRDYLADDQERQEPGSTARLHRRAAAWYADTGRMELAIEHGFKGQDTDAMAAYLTAALLPQLYAGHGDRLERWLGWFNGNDFLRHPPLAVSGAWIHILYGRPEPAIHLADLVERAMFSGDPGDGSATFESSKAILRAVMARHGPRAMLADASLAVDAESPGSPWRSNALLMLGSAHRLLGDAAAADVAFADAVGAGAMAGAMGAWASRASLAMARRDWAAAERFARESHAIRARAHLGSILPALLTHAVAARVAIHHGDHARAREELLRAQVIRHLATWAAPWFSVEALLELARAYLALSDTPGARNVVSEAETIVRRCPDLGVANMELAEMRERLNRASAGSTGSTALTTAELRLLPVLSTPLTFKEIGDRLFLSHHTVKTQAISIYGKLGASSRSEAVERAIDLGLLEPFPGVPPSRRPAQA